MDLKEFLFTALAIAIGVVVAKIIQSKLPASLGGNATWEESYEKLS